MVTTTLFRIGKVLPLFLSLALSGCDDLNDQFDKPGDEVVRPVKTLVVEPVDLMIRRSYPATVLPSQQAELSFRVAGRIVQLPVRAADLVDKGDVIAQLDPRDFKSEIVRVESQLDQARAQLSGMTSGARSEDLAALQAAVDAEAAQVKVAREQADRTRKLFKQKVVAKARLDKDLAQLAVAEANLRVREQELAKGRAGSRSQDVAAQQATIRGIEAQLAIAKDNLSDATLRAPFAGIIAKRQVDKFTNIQPNEPVVVLQKMSTLDLKFDVPGPDVVKLSQGKNRTIQTRLDDVPGQTFDAALVEFSTVADPATQTYAARVTMKQPKAVTVLAGMMGTVVVTARKEGTKTNWVPVTAITSEADGSAFVWIVAKPDNRLKKRPVKTGEAAGANIAVLNGLAAGDTIVIAGLSQLRPDMVVRPISKIAN
ncbi:MAG: efflux RND transporter periplasmic adaptor subunit [Halocynthiibacter sp.]